LEPKPPTTTAAYQLPRLEHFDPAVFLPKNKSEEDVCAFILMLAHVYNDLRDVMFAYNLLYENVPQGKPSKTAEWGNYSGLKLHVLRLIQAHFRETLQLIRGRREVLASPMFQAIIQSLSKRDKQCWATLVEAAEGTAGTPTNEFRVFLNEMRNKITSHYAGLDQILAGYRRKFFDPSGIKLQDAYISRGTCMAEHRFHFADAAAEGFLTGQLAGKEEEFRQKMVEFARNINEAIYSIVDKFIQNVRKTAYYVESEESSARA